MTSQIKVWIVDPQNPGVQPKFDPIPRYVTIADFETMEKQAIHMLKLADYKVSTINHGVDGTLVAYVYPKHLKPVHAKQVPGWIFKRPDVPPTT